MREQGEFERGGYRIWESVRESVNQKLSLDPVIVEFVKTIYSKEHIKANPFHGELTRYFEIRGVCYVGAVCLMTRVVCTVAAASATSGSVWTVATSSGASCVAHDTNPAPWPRGAGPQHWLGEAVG